MNAREAAADRAAQDQAVWCAGCGTRVEPPVDRFCGSCGHDPAPPAAAATGAGRGRGGADALPAGDPWPRVRALSGRRLSTLRSKPFLVQSVDGDYVTVVPASTGKPRPVRRAEVEDTCRLLAADPGLTASDVRAAGASEANPVYALAMARALAVAETP